jgi:hypothetical protein
MKKQDRTKRTYVTKAIGSLMPKLMKPALNNHSLNHSRLILEWDQIVGPELARYSQPEKLFFQTPQGQRQEGTLTIRVTSGAALEFQHLTGMLIERINQFFGYKALTRIILKHGLKHQAAAIVKKAAKSDPSRQETVSGLISDLPESFKESLETIGLRVK